MGATEDWNELVAATPDVAAAYAGIGTRGGDRRSRVRRRAAELDAGRLTIPALAWELQSAAADGDARTRVTAAYARYRNDVQAATRQTMAAAASAPRPASHGAETMGSRGHVAWFVILLIVALLAPAAILPARAGGGFVSDLDQIALLSGIVSLVMSIVGLVYVLRVSRPLVGAAVPIILAIWVLVGVFVACLRVADDPFLMQPSVIAGIVLMVVAAVLYGIAAVLLRGARRTPAAAPSPVDGTAAALADALAGEDADAAMIRRAAYADGILTLMKRGELDTDDAATLLRAYSA